MNHAPRTGMSGEVGMLMCQHFVGGSQRILRMYAEPRTATECDFWFCTLGDAANEPHFFGPTAA